MVCASFGALFLSLGDWAVFHLFVSPHPYKKIIRVLVDLFIVVSIFITFRTINSPIVFSTAMSLYFILGVGYHFLLINEHLIDKTADRITILQGVLAIVSVLLTVGHFLDRKLSDLLLIGSSGLGIVWGIANLYLANIFLISTSHNAKGTSTTTRLPGVNNSQVILSSPDFKKENSHEVNKK